MKQYSQHQEDIYLWNYMKELEVTPFFIELGACDGKNLSNCRLFAEHGWGGICVEANPDYFKDLFLLYAENEKVTCFNAAMIPDGWPDGVVPFRIYPDMIDHSGIHKYPKYEPCITTEVETMKYDQLPLQPTGLISIDLEGFDTDILTSMMLSEHLPEFVIIESNTLEERRHQVDLLNIEYDIINILDVNTIWKRREQ